MARACYNQIWITTTTTAIATTTSTDNEQRHMQVVLDGSPWIALPNATITRGRVGDGRKFVFDGIGCDYLINVQMLSLDGESAVQAHVSSATYRYMGNVAVQAGNSTTPPPAHNDTVLPLGNRRLFCQPCTISNATLHISVLGDPGAPYELGVLITNRSLVLGQTVKDKVLESPSINLVSNSVNNARFWYYDVPEDIISYAPLEIYVSDVTSTAMIPARLTAFNSYCPMLLEAPADLHETFLEFTTQGLLSLTRFGPELKSGRWYFRVDSAKQKEFSIRIDQGLPYNDYLLYEFLSVLIFLVTVVASLVSVFAWFVWSQPASDDILAVEEADEQSEDNDESAESNRALAQANSINKYLPRYESERDLTGEFSQPPDPLSKATRTDSSSSGTASRSSTPLSESQERAKLEDDIYHPLEYSVRGDVESIEQYEARLTPFERNCLRYMWRYRQYIGNTVLLGMFFGIPALQVITQEMDMLNTGDRNLCFFNELCMRPHAFGKGEGTFQVMAWNNVFSNIGYLIVGIGLMMYVVAVQLWRTRRGRRVRLVPRDFSFGWAMGIGFIWEGIFSAMYHLCPTPIIFQVDTVFMFTMAILCFVELFRKRFGWVWSAWRTFVALAVLLFINYLGTIANQLETRTYEYLFLSFLLVSNAIGFLAGTAYTIVRIRKNGTNSYTWFWGFVSFAFLLSATFALVSLVADSNSSLILGSVVVSLVILPVLVYHSNKLKVWFLARGSSSSGGSRRVLFGQCILYTATLVVLFVSLLFFAGMFGIPDTSNKELTPAESRAQNSECLVGEFYDAHDVWHFLSALGLLLAALALFHTDYHEASKPGMDVLIAAQSRTDFYRPVE